MARKLLLVEPKKKAEVVDLDLDEEDPMAADLMERENHLVIGLPALVGDHEAKGKLLVRDKVATSLPGADKRK